MRKPNAFTLIELMIVIAIIGVLTALATVNFQDARERARDVQRKSDLKTIQNTLEVYKNDHIPQTYPATATWKTDLITGNYLKELPSDPTYRVTPSAWTDYSYTRNVSDTLEYALVTCLENGEDPEKDTTNICTTGYSYTLNAP